MGLIRTILALVILVILFHIGMYYVGVDQGTNGLTEALYSLGQLLEAPANATISALPNSITGQIPTDTTGFYFTAFVAAALYFILYLLLGAGRRQ